jgi:hypothetical protein
MKGFRALTGACVACLAAGAWSSACATDPTGVRLVVTASVAVPDAVDQLRITVVGSRPDGDHPLCQPWHKEFALSSDADLPFELGIEKGTEFTKWVTFRVEGLRAGVTVLRREIRAPWPDEGVRDVSVPLDTLCLPPPDLCPDPLDLHLECIGGECAGNPWPGLFAEDNPDIDPAAPLCLTLTR